MGTGSCKAQNSQEQQEMALNSLLFAPINNANSQSPTKPQLNLNRLPTLNRDDIDNFDNFDIHPTIQDEEEKPSLMQIESQLRASKLSRAQSPTKIIKRAKQRQSLQEDSEIFQFCKTYERIPSPTKERSDSKTKSNHHKRHYSALPYDYHDLCSIAKDQHLDEAVIIYQEPKSILKTITSEKSVGSSTKKKVRFGPSHRK